MAAITQYDCGSRLFHFDEIVAISSNYLRAILYNQLMLCSILCACHVVPRYLFGRILRNSSHNFIGKTTFLNLEEILLILGEAWKCSLCLRYCCVLVMVLVSLWFSFFKYLWSAGNIFLYSELLFVVFLISKDSFVSLCETAIVLFNLKFSI